MNKEEIFELKDAILLETRILFEKATAHSLIHEEGETVNFDAMQQMKEVLEISKVLPKKEEDFILQMQASVALCSYFSHNEERMVMPHFQHILSMPSFQFNQKTEYEAV